MGLLELLQTAATGMNPATFQQSAGGETSGRVDSKSGLLPTTTMMTMRFGWNMARRQTGQLVSQCLCQNGVAPGHPLWSTLSRNTKSWPNTLKLKYRLYFRHIITIQWQISLSKYYTYNNLLFVIFINKYLF